ncbi:Arm DNA-binding domain-containing protein [Bacteroides fragilis]
MRQTFSLLFFLKKRQNHMDGLHPIMVRITINGKSVEICTGQKALLANWSIRLHQCVGSCAKQTNLFLKSIRFRLNQIFYQQSLYGETTTPQKIKDTFTGADKKNHYYFLYLNYIMRV